MTTTPADVLTKLQAAWRTPSLLVSGDIIAAEAEPATIAYCGPHNDATEWEFRPDKYNRPGWRAAYCGRCGRFIGCQPPPKQKAAQSRKARNGNEHSTKRRTKETATAPRNHPCQPTQ